MLDLQADTATLLAAFERAILSALDLDPTEIDASRLALAYRDVSSQLTGELLGPSASLFTDPMSAAVFGLIYAARTFHAAHRILAAYPPGRGPIAELGAGWGPFALRAELGRVSRTIARGSKSAPAPGQSESEALDPLGLRDQSISAGPSSTDVSESIILVDADRSALDRASRLFTTCGLRSPTCVVSDLDQFHAAEPLGAIAVPFALNELPSRSDHAALRRRVDRWLSILSPAGRLYLIEPGIPRLAHQLQRLRDSLPRGVFVHAPCTGASTCPLLPNPNDWCHFTWQIPPTPLVRAVADKAQRRWQEQHVSFLVLSREPYTHQDDMRVLDVRPHGRAKVVARTCTPGGLIPLTALRRSDAYDRLSTLAPGALVRASGERKGDGVRISDGNALEVIGPL